MRGGAALSLAAAALFGASAPFAKLLLPRLHPLPFTALLYLGAGLSLVRIRGAAVIPAEARLRGEDLPLLALIALGGGVLGPLLMLFGLERVSGVAGSLLLNLEAPFTVLAAVAFFGDHLWRGGALAAGLIVAAAALLSAGSGELRATAPGAALLAAACAAWALDNNLSARLALRDPVALVRAKTLAAGTVTALLALFLRLPLPSPGAALLALLLGAISYGLSQVLMLRAMRVLGAARQALWFATAPFIGALLSVPLLGERPGPREGMAFLLMIAGAALLRSERHAHRHTHEPTEHDHAHVHDAHHLHGHDGPASEPHAHPHRHEALTHDHPHVPDLHHRHRHR